MKRKSRKVKLPEPILEFFRKQGSIGGRKGGALGGKKAAQSMTPEQRKERAAKAVAARDSKRQRSKKLGLKVSEREKQNVRIQAG